VASLLQLGSDRLILGCQLFECLEVLDLAGQGVECLDPAAQRCVFGGSLGRVVGVIPIPRVLHPPLQRVAALG
jgi:hypothetical protein